MPRPPAQQWSKRPRQPKTISSKRQKPPALWASGKSKSRRPPRQSHSEGSMATSCEIWRCQSSKRKAEVKLTYSLPSRPLCTPAPQSSGVIWPLLTTFYWGRLLHPFASSNHQGFPQWKNSQLQLFLPYQCPSSSLGPKDNTPPQILWRACLWVELLWRWLWEDPPTPSSEKSCPGKSTQGELCWGIWPRLCLGKGGQEGILLKTFLQLHHGWHLQCLRDIQADGHKHQVTGHFHLWDPGIMDGTWGTQAS